MVENYDIYETNKGRYMTFDRSPLKKGYLRINKKGFGFVDLVDEEDIYKKVDVVAGTSIGGILAIIYSINNDYKEVNQMFKQAVPKIFRKRALGGLRGPMYCNQALKEFMKKIMGEYKLSDINKLNEKDFKDCMHSSGPDDDVL